MNNENPAITVRMSAYNHERYVEAAIRSILNQTFQDFELIVIDDGSSDRTPEIIGALSREHGFRFERQENQGIPRTLNRLIGMARGRYITGCASDDLYPPDRLKNLYGALEANPDAALAYGKVEYIDDSGNPEPVRNAKEQLILSGQIFDRLVDDGMFVRTGTAMVRRTAYEEVGLYDEALMAEDYDWLLRCSQKFPVVGIDVRLLQYRVHDQCFRFDPVKQMQIYYSERAMVAKWSGAVGRRLKGSRISYWLRLVRGSSMSETLKLMLQFPFYIKKRKYRAQFMVSAKSLLKWNRWDKVGEYRL